LVSQADVPVVAVAQLVESRIVIPVVVGSSPISHPMSSKASSHFPRLKSQPEKSM
jgi:hypothetical protein